MNLRRMTVAAALGATVLTTVPTFVAPYTAYASCVENNSSCGNDDQPPGEEVLYPDDPSDPSDPSDPGDPGDNGGQGPVDGILPTVVTDGINVSEAPEPAPADATLPTVVVDGLATSPEAPVDPAIPEYSWGSDSGGGGGEERAVVHSEGKTWEERGNCYRNNSNITQKHTESISYNVSYQTSANITAKATDVLSATLGSQLNTTIVKNYGLDISLEPGQSWALHIEYQTKVYAITTLDWLSRSYKTEFVNVTAPTGVLTGRAC